MEYSVNGDMVTIVHPVVLLTGICDTPVFAKKPTDIVGVLIISGGVRFYHDQPHTNSNFTGNLQGFSGITIILSGNYLGKTLTFWELSGKI